MLLAWASLDLGDAAGAEALVAMSIRRAREEGHRLALARALRVQALVAIRQGCWAEAHDVLEEGLSLTRSMPYPYAEASLLHAYGQLHAQKGEPVPAQERLEAVPGPA
jgi:hypothetical protein